MNSYHATIMRSIYEPRYLWLIGMFRVFTVFGYLPLSVRVFLLFVLDNLSSHFIKYVIMCVICNVVLCDFEQIVRYETHVLLVLYKIYIFYLDTTPLQRGQPLSG